MLTEPIPFPPLQTSQEGLGFPKIPFAGTQILLLRFPYSIGCSNATNSPEGNSRLNLVGKAGMEGKHQEMKSPELVKLEDPMPLKMGIYGHFHIFMENFPSLAEVCGFSLTKSPSGGIFGMIHWCYQIILPNFPAGTAWLQSVWVTGLN